MSHRSLKPSHLKWQLTDICRLNASYNQHIRYADYVKNSTPSAVCHQWNLISCFLHHELQQLLHSAVVAELWDIICPIKEALNIVELDDQEHLQRHLKASSFNDQRCPPFESINSDRIVNKEVSKRSALKRDDTVNNSEQFQAQEEKQFIEYQPLKICRNVLV